MEFSLISEKILIRWFKLTLNTRLNLYYSLIYLQASFNGEMLMHCAISWIIVKFNSQNVLQNNLFDMFIRI